MAALNKRTAAWSSLKRVAAKIVADDYVEDGFGMQQDRATLQAHFEKLETAHGELVALARDDTELWSHIKLWDEVEDLYNEACVALRRELARCDAQNTDAPSNMAGGAVSSQGLAIKLERLAVPKFDGTMRNWLAFKDTFETLVHSQEFPEAYKLDKLREAVHGDAVALVGGMYSGGYDEVWAALKARYDNPKQLAEIHVARLIGFNPPHAESTSALLSVVDTVRESLRALAVMNLPVDQWDALAVPMIVAKLPTITQQAWGMSRTTNQIPPLADLLAFLETRAHSLVGTVWREMESKPKSDDKTATLQYRGTSQADYKRPGSRLMRTNLIATTSGHCQFCNDASHQIGKCTRLLACSPAERFTLLKGSNLCFNCLKPGHSTKACGSTNCRICNGRHHTLLCRSSPAQTPPLQESKQQAQATPQAPAKPNQAGIPPRVHQ
ncbi:uncharacterized protein LOC119665476 [Teleopsis dalmanni]|uniref:uncharacterized protein LOC119665474 n=1 Tax=Teleopsis dalmanni TaxID=139649 RepID=UPI0018CE20F6|nr:uncharacterized protein LOC119665474 [Teleopsis dalmanni]XP_037930626.1 uncharacterized protein LOC119665476 [Teleopsis dalmanni]